MTKIHSFHSLTMADKGKYELILLLHQFSHVFEVWKLAFLTKPVTCILFSPIFQQY